MPSFVILLWNYFVAQNRHIFEELCRRQAYWFHVPFSAFVSVFAVGLWFCSHTEIVVCAWCKWSYDPIPALVLFNTGGNSVA